MRFCEVRKSSLHVVCAFSFLFLGCTHNSARHQAPTAQEVEVQTLQNAQLLLQSSKYEEAQKAFQNFAQSYPQSLYFSESKLGEAQAQLGLENFDAALKLSREVSLTAGGSQPKIQARALYLMSFAYEALGEDLKALASLLDAYKLRSHLSTTVGQAEIPARIAGLYAKFGRESDATKYLALADKGLSLAISQGSAQSDPHWLAKTYYQMGSVSINQLTLQNYSMVVESLRWVQSYLIKGLKLNDPVWSGKSLERLKKTYQSFYQIAESDTNRQSQSQKVSDVLELIHQAELYKALSEHKIVSYEQDFYLFLNEVRRQCERLLYDRGAELGLTEAAKERNSLRRFPRQPKPEVKPLDMGEDPNL